jgi:hypothetical protein
VLTGEPFRESLEDYTRLLKGLREDIQPVGALEEVLVEQLAFEFLLLAVYTKRMYNWRRGYSSRYRMIKTRAPRTPRRIVRKDRWSYGENLLPSYSSVMETVSVTKSIAS